MTQPHGVSSPVSRLYTVGDMTINEYGAAGGIFDEHFNICLAGFHVLTSVAMKTPVLCDKTQCSSVKVNQRIGGTYRRHLQDRRGIQARN
jgi:hypothetical protein